jgi:hypothetical protein
MIYAGGRRIFFLSPAFVLEKRCIFAAELKKK